MSSISERTGQSKPGANGRRRNPVPVVRDLRTFSAESFVAYDKVKRAKPGNGADELQESARFLAGLVRRGEIDRKSVELGLTQAAVANGLDRDPDCGQDGIAAIIKAELDGKPQPKTVTRDDYAGLVTVCLADVELLPILFLVAGYIAKGKLLLVAGDGGHGKSMLSLYIAARFTRGEPCFGLSYEAQPPCDVLLISCEDDLADTVKARLISLGADLSRVHHVGGIRGKDGKLLPFSLAHYQALEEELKRRPDVRLVIIDPAGAYVGRTGVDDHKDSELRTLLAPLAELAAKHGVAILLIKHLNKGATARAVHKVSGSMGYVNAVRAAFVVIPDPDDQEKKLFLPVKFNLGPKPSGLAYRMRSLDTDRQDELVRQYGGHLSAEDQQRLAKQLFTIEWLGPVDADADQLLGDQDKRRRAANKVEQAAEWLLKFLEKYAYPSNEIIAAGLRAGFTKDNLWRAKGAIADKIGHKKSSGKRGVFWWGIGDADHWTPRPDPSQNTAPEIPDIPEIPDNPELPDIGKRVDPFRIPSSTLPDNFGITGNSGMSGNTGISGGNSSGIPDNDNFVVQP